MLSFHSHRSACSSVLPCLDAWQLNARRFPPHFWWHHCCYGRGRFVKKGVGGWIMLNPRFASEILRFFSFFHSNTSTNSHGCHHSDEDEKPARVGRLDFFLGGEIPANLVGLLVGSEVRTFIILHPGVMIYSNYENLRTWMEQVVCHEPLKFKEPACGLIIQHNPIRFKASIFFCKFWCRRSVLDEIPLVRKQFSFLVKK